jgi:hypothetical protein
MADQLSQLEESPLAEEEFDQFPDEYLIKTNSLKLPRI